MRAIPVLLAVVFYCILLPTAQGQVCEACDGDLNGDCHVTVDEIIKAVNNALYGCSRTVTPITSPYPTATSAPPTHTRTPVATSTPTLCPEDMVPIGDGFCIDRYEVSRPDATSESFGSDESVATSRAGVLPWMVNPMTHQHLLTFQAACASAGKHLCTKEEWLAACQGTPPSTTYVFGNTFEPETCNCVDTFCDDYCQDHGITPDRCNTGTNCGYAYNCFHEVATGTFPQCTNEYGTFDINGNVWEVVPSSSDGRGYEVRGGAFNCASAAARLKCTYNAGWNDLYAGFRCCYTP